MTLILKHLDEKKIEVVEKFSWQARRLLNGILEPMFRRITAGTSFCDIRVHPDFLSDSLKSHMLVKHTKLELGSAQRSFLEDALKSFETKFPAEIFGKDASRVSLLNFAD